MLSNFIICGRETSKVRFKFIKNQSFRKYYGLWFIWCSRYRNLNLTKALEKRPRETRHIEQKIISKDRQTIFYLSLSWAESFFDLRISSSHQVDILDYILHIQHHFLFNNPLLNSIPSNFITLGYDISKAWYDRENLRPYLNLSQLRALENVIVSGSSSFRDNLN